MKTFRYWISRFIEIEAETEEEAHKLVQAELHDDETIQICEKVDE